MTKLLLTTAAAIALSTGAFAKAHDQGKAGGDTTELLPGQLAGQVDDTVKGGLRGMDASSKGKANGKAIGKDK